ncbi:hypothetical protein EMIT043CA1_30337 [Pseudomonas brassicacearum]
MSLDMFSVGGNGAKEMRGQPFEHADLGYRMGDPNRNTHDSPHKI